MKKTNHNQQPDVTDYDGMGNYGRFPESREQPTSNHADLVTIIVTLLLPVIYFIIR